MPSSAWKRPSRPATSARSRLSRRCSTCSSIRAKVLSRTPSPALSARTRCGHSGRGIPKTTSPSCSSKRRKKRSSKSRLPRRARRNSTASRISKLVKISCVPERMLFTVKDFAVAPGQPVKLVFTNPDATDHNLVIVKPDALAEVGMAANEMAKDPRNANSDFVPPQKRNLILHASPMIGPTRASQIACPALHRAERAGDLSLCLHVPRALGRDERRDGRRQGSSRGRRTLGRQPAEDHQRMDDGRLCRLRETRPQTGRADGDARHDGLCQSPLQSMPRRRWPRSQPWSRSGRVDQEAARAKNCCGRSSNHRARFTSSSRTTSSSLPMAGPSRA